MARASPALATFNAGELSPFIEGRTDTEKYGAGCKRLEQYIPTIQGPVIRRGGRPFVHEVRDSSKRAWLVRFEFSVEQAYMLEFDDGYLRFYFGHGIVESSPGVPYEIVSPYSATDLVASDGETCALRVLQSADVLYIFHPSFAPRKLTRLGATNWVFSLLETAGGPFKTANLTATTVYASAQTGVVALTASSAIFTAAMVGSLFYLGERITTSAKPWASGQVYVLGDRARHDGKNYIAATGGTSGTDGPTHTEGTVFDGPAVSWTYEDPGYGYGTITGYTSTTQVSLTVIDALPFLAVLVGNASTSWAFGAWSALEGWPTHAAFFRERLVIGRGIEVWLSVSGDFENFHDRDNSGLIVTDSAFKRTLVANSINTMLWMEVFSPTSEALMIGTAGVEFAIRSQTESQPFGPENCTSQPVSKIGSSSVAPVRVGNAILFAQRSGKKLQDLTYDYYSGGGNGSNDQTLFANHILIPRIAQLVYQQEPFSTVWTRLRNGQLVAMTYSREQYQSPPHGGWHRHPLSDGIVECIEAIPNGDRNELWAIIKITVSGATRRYVTYMAKEDELEADPQNAFYMDLGGDYSGYALSPGTLTPGAGATVSGTAGVPFEASAPAFAGGDVGRYLYRRYSYLATDETGNPYTAYATAKAKITAYTDSTHVVGTITAAFPSLGVVPIGEWALTVTTVSGLAWLEGKTIDVLVDGATHPQRTVSAGAIALQAPAARVHAGLTMPARLMTMRLNAGAQDGTSQGKKGRIPNLVLRFLRTVGQRIGTAFGSGMQDLHFRTPSNPMDNAVPLFTGDMPVDFPGDWDTNPWMCMEQPYPLPSTLVGIYPQVVVSDKG